MSMVYGLFLEETKNSSSSLINLFFFIIHYVSINNNMFIYKPNKISELIGERERRKGYLN